MERDGEIGRRGDHVHHSLRKIHPHPRQRHRPRGREQRRRERGGHGIDIAGELAVRVESKHSGHHVAVGDGEILRDERRRPEKRGARLVDKVELRPAQLARRVLTRAGSAPHQVPRRSLAHGRAARRPRRLGAAGADGGHSRPPRGRLPRRRTVPAPLHEHDLHDDQAPRVAHAGGKVRVVLDVERRHGRGVDVAVAGSRRDLGGLGRRRARRAVKRARALVVERHVHLGLQRVPSVADAEALGAERERLDREDPEPIPPRRRARRQSARRERDVASDLPRGEHLPVPELRRGGRGLHSLGRGVLEVKGVGTRREGAAAAAARRRLRPRRSRLAALLELLDVAPRSLTAEHRLDLQCGVLLLFLRRRLGCGCGGLGVGLGLCRGDDRVGFPRRRVRVDARELRDALLALRLDEGFGGGDAEVGTLHAAIGRRVRGGRRLRRGFGRGARRWLGRWLGRGRLCRRDGRGRDGRGRVARCRRDAALLRFRRSR